MSYSQDVLVVGAGPAGCVAATLLARAGLRVVMLDRARFPRPKLCGDSLNPGTLALLERLELAGYPMREGVPVNGMIVTGPRGARVEARYPAGVQGRSVSRFHLDNWLVQQAVDAGVCFREGVRVLSATRGRRGDRIESVVVQDPSGARHTIDAALTIAADGRRSTLAFGLGLASQPSRPRRWAVGAYVEGAEGVSSFGEMHIRRGRYIGIAPLPGDTANVCVVTSDAGALSSHRDLGRWLKAEIATDPDLAPRLDRARLVNQPLALGPLAVDAWAAGVPGLLLAGDSAGFIDPMTGDGMHFAIRGAELAARAALLALGGDLAFPHEWLAEQRRLEFARKQRFNRALRALVSWPSAVDGAAGIARMLPSLVSRLVCIAGDVERTRGARK